jgi:hypothetical protein
MKSLLGILVLGFGLPSWALSPGAVTRTPVDANSIGCGILNGRLQYLAKTHEEVMDQIPRSDNDYDAKLLQIIAKRYPHTFQEDQGYIITITWQLDTPASIPQKFELDYPGMIWSTQIGQMPDGVQITVSGNQLTLEAKISTFDYCLGSNKISLHISQDGQATKDLAAQWKPALTL